MLFPVAFLQTRGIGMYKLFVALRYLRRNWLSFVGIAAVGIGVLVMICVLSVMKGFDEEFRTRMRAAVSDLVVERWTDDTFEITDALMDRIRRTRHVVACSPHYEGIALIRLGERGQQKRFGEFVGIDLDAELKTTKLADYWRAWRGREAREEIEQFLLIAPEAPDELTAEVLSEALAGFRPDDMAALSPEHRKALKRAAKRLGISLQAVYAQSVKGVPVWGEVDDPARESPAFPGAELVVIGRDAERNLVSMDVGEQVFVFAPTDMFDGRAIRRCVIKGKFRTGMYNLDTRVILLPLADVQHFMGEPGAVTSINIRVDSFDNAPTVRAELLGLLTPDELAHGVKLLRHVAPRDDRAEIVAVADQVRIIQKKATDWFAEGDQMVIQATLEAEAALFGRFRTLKDAGRLDMTRHEAQELQALFEEAAERNENKLPLGFRVSTWEDKRRTFLRALWLERRIISLILFFVILIAGFLILAILHTTVVTKMRDIGILKSIGGSVRGIMSIFLLNGLFIGVVGSALGTAGGLAVTRNINQIEAFLHRLLGFQLFPSNVYYLDRIPVIENPWPIIVWTSLTAVAMSFLASAYPAWKAARLDAVETLRYE